MKNKELRPFNDKGEPHGNWKIYNNSNKLLFKGAFINGIKDGYWEQCHIEGERMYKGTHSNGKMVGYIEYYKNDVLNYRGYTIL